MYSQPLDQFPYWQSIVAGLIFLGITILYLAWVRRRPYLAVGWFWFVGTLVPVIGLMQVGIQTMADRYTYIPHIGLLLMLVWGGKEGRSPPVVHLYCEPASPHSYSWHAWHQRTFRHGCGKTALPCGNMWSP